MNPFNATPTCPKCGSTDINRVWHDAEECDTHCGPYPGPTYTSRQTVEHHRLGCRVCNFAWQEEVKS